MASVYHREPSRSELHLGWHARVGSGPAPETMRGAVIPAIVPGAIHDDLFRAGLIDDPYLDRNEQLQGWIGLTDFTYSTTFEWTPQGHEHVELVFQGLDTVADISLNDVALGSTANMHRSYRFAVDTLLRDGDNVLTVAFRSPVRYADTQSELLGRRPHANHHPYNAIRKMACSFGWDWGPDLATSGIWKPVALESWSGARLRNARPIATVSDGRGVVDVHVELARSGDEELVLHAVLNGVETASVVQAHESTGIVHLEVPEPELWWPRGLGDQALSTIEVTLTDTEGHALDTVCRRVGFRTVAIDTTPDAEGTPFVLRVNGTDIRVRGANWTPDDALVHRVTRDRLAQRLAQAEYANVNLLRIWGGGVFESDDLYELCDEAGMLVWQDFLFACAAYADEGPLADEVEAEARENVARLASHPALVVWNGNNENLWGYEDWSWMARLDGASWGSRYYEDLLPAIVRELSPHVPYTPGSPFSAGVDAHPNDPRHGTVHIWDVWNTVDYSAYVDNRPRFVAEFGWQGPPTWTTLTRAVHDSPLTPESPGVMTHQKAAKGNDKLLDGLVPHFRSPQRMRDWHWAMQLNQAVAMRFGIEHLRSLAPHCSGMIMWQFNDCWPVTSWAAVDGDGRRKPLLDALRRAYADRLITIQPRDGALSVVAVNDGTTPWSGRLEIARRSFDGDMLGSFGADVNVPPGSAVTVAVPQDVTESHDPTREYLRAHLDGAEVARRLYVEPRDAVLRDRPFTATAERENDVWLVRVRATSLVVDLALLADSAHPDAVAYGSLVWLDAGSEALITVSASVDLPSDALVSASVLRCANDLCQEVKANGGEDLGRAIPSI